MTTCDLYALLSADLTDAANRGVLHDALCDLGHEVDLDHVYAEAYEDAQQACNESGTSATPDGGWWGWLGYGMGLDDICRAFGLLPKGVDVTDLSREKREDFVEGPAWAAARAVYEAGALTGADDWQTARDAEEQADDE